MTSSAGASRAAPFPFEPDFAHSSGKVLDFLSGEDWSSSLESLRLLDAKDWVDGRTRSSAVGNLAIGRGMVSSVRVLLESVFLGISPMS
jgi:hypothetical protein